MNKYRISYSMGYAGAESEEIIEAESLGEAEEIAWDIACQKISIYQKISTWAELIEGEEPEES